jgi:hypothetical protein
MVLAVGCTIGSADADGSQSPRSGTAASATTPVVATTSTASGSSATAAGFTVKGRIEKLRPTSARRGGRVIIQGSGFGATRAAGFVRFGSVKCARYLTWSKTRITCRVPARSRYGRLRVRVTTAAGPSNARGFFVKH